MSMSLTSPAPSALRRTTVAAGAVGAVATTVLDLVAAAIIVPALARQTAR